MYRCCHQFQVDILMVNLLWGFHSFTGLCSLNKHMLVTGLNYNFL